MRVLMGRWPMSCGLVVAALGFTSVMGQSAADGSVKGNVYTNRYFHVSLTLPQNFHAVDLSALHAPGALASNEFEMMAAREGGGPSGIIMFAEKLDAAPSHVVDEQDFLNRAQKGWDAGQVLDGKQMGVQRGGWTFDELDYELPKAEFDSMIVTRAGNYLLTFKCSAKTQRDLKIIDDAVMAMRHD